MSEISLEWDRGSATLQSLAGMLAPIRFRLPSGREAQPMQIAPWADEPESGALPGVLRRLRGDWACVPFGFTPEGPLPADWPQGLQADAGEEPHGFGSNHEWTLTREGEAALAARIAYPETSPIASLTRRVFAIPGAARVDIELTVEARRACRLPIGLHPTFRLPTEPGAARLDPGAYAQVWTYPVDPAPTPTLFEPNARAASLSALPAKGGGMRDATLLPFAEPCENLLLLEGASGRCAVENRAENYRVVLMWDNTHFPSLMLWMSNRGRQFAPWNGRHLALGLEPVCAPFDFGAACAARETPLSRAGVATSFAFSPGVPFVTRYAIAVEEI